MHLFKQAYKYSKNWERHFFANSNSVFSEFFVTPNRVTSLHGARPVNRNDLGMAIRYVPRGAGCTKGG